MTDTPNPETPESAPAVPPQVTKAPSAHGGRLYLAAGIAALAAVVTHPTQLTVYDWARLLFGDGLAAHVPRQNITVADGLFLLAFVLWLVAVVADGRLWRRIRAYPVALVAFFAAAILSIGLAASGQGGAAAVKAGLKELVQLGILFVCAFCVLADYLRDSQWRRRLVVGFLAASTLGIAWGLVEYSRLRPGDLEAAGQGYTVSPTEVDGPFGLRRGQEPGEKDMIRTASNRSVLGSWVTLIVPLLTAVALWGTCPWLRSICGLAALAGLPLLLTGGLWAAGLLALLVVAFVRSRWVFVGAAVAVGVLFVLLPAWHGDVLLDSVMLRRGSDPFFTLRLYGDDATEYVAEEGGEPSPLNFGQFDEKELAKWQQKFYEWQPGLKAVADRPLMGAGLDRYQRTVGGYYRGVQAQDVDPAGTYALAKSPVNLMEFGANSNYLVWTVETGFVGLIALLWVLMAGIRWGARAARQSSGYDRALAVGVAGAIAASAFGMFFAEYVVRGVGVAFVFVLALGAALAQSRAAENPAEVEPGAGEG